MPGIRDHVPIDLQPLLNRLDRNFLQWMRILNNPEWRAQSFLATTDLDEAINFVQELYDAQQFLIRGQELPARFGHLPAWIIHSSWQEDRSNMYVRSMSYFSYAPYMYDAIVYSAHNPQLQMTIDNLHFYAAIRQRIVELPAIERARFDLERQAIPRRQGDLLDRDIEVEHWVVIADAADTFVLHLSMGPERRMARIVDMRDFTITDAANDIVPANNAGDIRRADGASDGRLSVPDEISIMGYPGMMRPPFDGFNSMIAARRHNIVTSDQIASNSAAGEIHGAGPARANNRGAPSPSPQILVSRAQYRRNPPTLQALPHHNHRDASTQTESISIGGFRANIRGVTSPSPSRHIPDSRAQHHRAPTALQNLPNRRDASTQTGRFILNGIIPTMPLNNPNVPLNNTAPQNNATMAANNQHLRESPRQTPPPQTPIMGEFSVNDLEPPARPSRGNRRSAGLSGNYLGAPRATAPVAPMAPAAPARNIRYGMQFNDQPDTRPRALPAARNLNPALPPIGHERNSIQWQLERAEREVLARAEREMLARREAERAAERLAREAQRAAETLAREAQRAVERAARDRAVQLAREREAERRRNEDHAWGGPNASLLRFFTVDPCDCCPGGVEVGEHFTNYARQRERLPEWHIAYREDCRWMVREEEVAKKAKEKRKAEEEGEGKEEKKDGDGDSEMGEGDKDEGKGCAGEGGHESQL